MKCHPDNLSDDLHAVPELVAFRHCSYNEKTLLHGLLETLHTFPCQAVRLCMNFKEKLQAWLGTFNGFRDQMAPKDLHHTSVHIVHRAFPESAQKYKTRRRKSLTAMTNRKTPFMKSKPPDASQTKQIQFGS